MSPTRRATPIRRVSLSMKVPTVVWDAVTPDSEREAALKHTRRCWLSTGTKVATTEEQFKLLTMRDNFPAARPALTILVFFGLTMRPIRLGPVMHIAEDRFRGAADHRVIEILDVQFGLYSTGDLIYCKCKQQRADRVSLLDTCR